MHCAHFTKGLISIDINTPCALTNLIITLSLSLTDLRDSRGNSLRAKKRKKKLSPPTPLVSAFNSFRHDSYRDTVARTQRRCVAPTRARARASQIRRSRADVLPTSSACPCGVSAVNEGE